MKLSRVRIKNFRSIENATLKFDPNFQILVGINESGKSNILKALSLLDEDSLPAREDVRQPLPHEPLVDEAYVRFIFTLEDSEMEDVLTAIKPVILASDLSIPILKKGETEMNLEEFIADKKEAFLEVDLLKREKTFDHWVVPKGFQIIKDWVKPTEESPEDLQVQFEPGNEVPFKDLKLIHNFDAPPLPKECLEKASPDDINSIVGDVLTDMVANSIPSTLFWQYSEKNLLPTQIKIDEFSSNPDICTPLRNMFQLAGINEIQKSLTEAKGIGNHGVRNLLERVAKTTTTHFQNVWKEYKSIEFNLMPNGINIDASVKDEHNHYGFAQRSDGFKRFVTFLLMISARVKSNSLTGALLIIDEPDTSLHPSGVKFLRDELLKISEKNYVVISTHSIFMIDSKNIERHLIVKKKNEKTSIEHANQTNLFDEEVIYNALGYSIFENLKEKNIIFEGWTDKRLFQVALGKVPGGYSKIKKLFKEVGICHAKGVGHIKSVTPVMELASRQCLILSDCDKSAIDMQHDYKKMCGYGTWKRYDELLSIDGVVTSEDFVEPKAFFPWIDKTRKTHPKLPELNGDSLVNARGAVYTLYRWLDNIELTPEQRKEIVEFIKVSVFENLKPSDIKKIYFDCLVEISKLLA